VHYEVLKIQKFSIKKGEVIKNKSEEIIKKTKTSKEIFVGKAEIGVLWCND